MPLYLRRLANIVIQSINQTTTAMKKRVYLLMLILIFSLSSFAQRVEMGLTMGATGYATTNNSSEYYNTLTNSNVDFGLSLNFPTKTWFSFQTEFNFIRRSTETYLGEINHVRVNSQALEIPLLFSFKFNTVNEKMSLYGHIGPNISMVLNQQLLTPVGVSLPPTQQTNFSFGDIYKIGATAEVGLRWDRTNRTAFTIGVRSSYDAISLPKKESTPTFNFRTFTLKASYIVKF